MDQRLTTVRVFIAEFDKEVDFWPKPNQPAPVCLNQFSVIVPVSEVDNSIHGYFGVNHDQIAGHIQRNCSLYGITAPAFTTSLY